MKENLKFWFMGTMFITIQWVDAAAIDGSQLYARSAAGLRYNHWTPSNPMPSIPPVNPLFNQPDNFGYSPYAVKYFPDIVCGSYKFNPAQYIGSEVGTVTKVSPFVVTQPDDYFWHIKVPLGDPNSDMAIGIKFSEGRGFNKDSVLVPGYYLYDSSEYTAAPNVSSLHRR